MTSRAEVNVRPRRDQERNRAALIAAGQHVFGTHGPDAPFDSVARHAGLSNATLYRHFPTRASLLVEIYRLGLAEHQIRLDELTTAEDPWQAFAGYAAWVFEHHFTDLALTRGLASLPNGVDAALDTQRRRTRDAFTTLIDAAKNQGRFRPDRWLDDVLLFFAAHETLAQLGEPARPASERLLTLLLDGVGVGQEIEPDADPPPPLTMDSVLTRHLARA